MRSHLPCFMLFLLCCSACKFQQPAQLTYQPLPLASPPPAPAPLAAAKHFLEKETQFDAFVALHQDSILTSWGQTQLAIMTHSARKSIMSVLYGMAIEKGLICLNASLAEMGIDDNKAPLTPTEKTCTVRDLLMSRSGIYIEAPGETADMKNARPQRGQHVPGSYFYYNNWGFNVLGTIFEQETKLSIGQAIEEWLAKPLGMQHFRADFVTYKKQNYSQHRQYIIYMSAEDMARIGMLMANEGRWKGKALLNPSWVSESTQPYSKDSGGNEPCDSYAYLWWVDTQHGTYWASGWGGQFMLIDQKNKLVIVSRNDTGRNLVEQGLFMWRGKQGWRKHHQLLYEWILQSLKIPLAQPQNRI